MCLAAGMFFHPQTSLPVEFYVSSESTIKVFNADGGYVRTFATTASAGIVEPSHSVFDAQGNFWVASEHNSAAIKIAPDGTALMTLTQSISGPEGLMLDGAGNVYVANEDGDSVSVFDPGGTLLRVIDNENSTPVSPYPGYPAIDYPHGLAVDASGLLYLANTSGNSIIKINLNADPVTRSVFHQFTTSMTPVGMAMDSAGNLFVSNFVSNEVNKFAPSGVEIRHQDGSAFITTALQSNGWSSNRALTIGADDSIYIPNEFTGTISVYDSAGSFVRTFGDGTGEADLHSTHYVSIRSDHEWVADASGLWTVSANWKDGAPGSAGDTALFGNAISAPRTVTLDGGRTLGTLRFSGAHGYTLNGGTLTLDNGQTAARLNVDSGQHSVASPLHFMNPGVIVTLGGAASQLTLTDAVTGSGPVTLTGGGTLRLANPAAANQFSTGAIELSAGTLLLGAPDQIADHVALTLSGGRLDSGGFGEAMGSLTLTADSVLDFGSAASVLSFASAAWSGGLLTIEHWSGSANGGGIDQLRFYSAPSQDLLDHIQFAEFGAAIQIVFNAGEASEYFEIVPGALAAVPELGAFQSALTLLIIAGTARRPRRFP